MGKEERKIEVTVPEGKEAKWVNGVLTLVDIEQKDNRPVTERVRTFSDAFYSLPKDHPLIKQWQQIGGCEDIKDVLAYLKLRIIAAALNEGWEPQFTTDERRYYPYFLLYTQKEIDEMDEEQKKELWLFGGYSANGSKCGLAVAYSRNVWSNSHADISARLAVKDAETAKYFGKQFIDIWADYVGPFNRE